MRDTVFNQSELASMVSGIGFQLVSVDNLPAALWQTRDARRQALVLEASILAELRERGINLRVLDSPQLHGRGGA